jgi:hypothetical protein
VVPLGLPITTLKAGLSMAEYIHPLPKGTYTISQEFGSNPNNGVNPPGGHNARDYAAAEGTPVYAVADGIVEHEGWIGGNSYLDNSWWFVPEFAGICVVIDHGDNRPDSEYGHLIATTVDKGQHVTQGQVIGYVGTTGYSSGNHCHFGMLPPGYDLNSSTYGRVNPLNYITAHTEDAAVFTRYVTNDVAFARVAPDSGAALAPEYPEGIAKGALLAVVGHVAGQDPYNTNDNAWYKTPRGYFVWANAAENNIDGLPDLN